MTLKCRRSCVAIFPLNSRRTEIVRGNVIVSVHDYTSGSLDRVSRPMTQTGMSSRVFALQVSVVCDRTCQCLQCPYRPHLHSPGALYHPFGCCPYLCGSSSSRSTSICMRVYFLATFGRAFLVLSLTGSQVALTRDRLVQVSRISHHRH